jgi:hypothetical protein
MEYDSISDMMDRVKTTPGERLFEGWKAVNLACHGIAPDKCIESFQRKYAGARASGQEMLDGRHTWCDLIQYRTETMSTIGAIRMLLTVWMIHRQSGIAF